MSQLGIFICGGPVTGKTTTAKEIVKYFEDAYNSMRPEDAKFESAVELITADGAYSYEAMMKNVALSLFKLSSVGKKPIAVVDAARLTVYDREELMQSVVTDSQIQWVAVYLERAWKFITIHNNDKEHHPYTANRLRSIGNMVQQPIRQEGFEFIYHVNGTNHIDLESFGYYLNQFCSENLNMVFPTKENKDEPFEKPAETEEMPCGDPTVSSSATVNTDGVVTATNAVNEA